MDELISDFVAEAREMLQSIEGELIAWEKDPGDRQRLDAIFRFVHTVKGNCGFFDFPRLQALSHAAEDVLGDLREGRRTADSTLVDAVLATIDRIGAMVDAIDSGEEFPEGGDEQLVAALSEEGSLNGLDEQEAARAAARRENARSQVRSVRLPVELIEHVMSGISDMVLARNELGRRMRETGGTNGLEGPFNRMSAILEEMREAISRARLQPVDTLFAPFPRMIRDLAAELGKEIDVEIETGNVELDREMMELVRDPLVHLVRNAVDHGIETPAERAAAGKDPVGRIIISARQTGNEIRFGLTDNGRGIDPDKLVAKAVESGLLTHEQAQQMSPRERTMLVCQAGLSTKEEVTEISGRGVGMDVVRANIERVGGSLGIDTTPGSGTRMLVNVPLTLSIVPSLLIRSGGQTFAIPRSYVEEVVRVDAEDVEMGTMGGADVAILREGRFPVVSLAEALELDWAEDSASRMLVLIRLVGGDIFALAIDEVDNLEELVIKPIAPALMATGLYVGAAQLDNGRPMLMLDVSGIARSVGLLRDVDYLSRDNQHRQDADVEIERVQALVFEDMDRLGSAVALDQVCRIERILPEKVRRDAKGTHVLVDGEILPIDLPDGQDLPEGRFECLRFTGEGGERLYPVRKVLDICAVPATEFRSGTIILSDEIVRVQNLGRAIGQQEKA